MRGRPGATSSGSPEQAHRDVERELPDGEGGGIRRPGSVAGSGERLRRDTEDPGKFSGIEPGGPAGGTAVEQGRAGRQRLHGQGAGGAGPAARSVGGRQWTGATRGKRGGQLIEFEAGREGAIGDPCTVTGVAAADGRSGGIPGAAIRRERGPPGADRAGRLSGGGPGCPRGAGEGGKELAGRPLPGASGCSLAGRSDPGGVELLERCHRWIFGSSAGFGQACAGARADVDCEREL